MEARGSLCASSQRSPGGAAIRLSSTVVMSPSLSLQGGMCCRRNWIRGILNSKKIFPAQNPLSWYFIAKISSLIMWWCSLYRTFYVIIWILSLRHSVIIWSLRHPVSKCQCQNICEQRAGRHVVTTTTAFFFNNNVWYIFCGLIFIISGRGTGTWNDKIKRSKTVAILVCIATSGNVELTCVLL